jgi:hypothetical protein
MLQLMKKNCVICLTIFKVVLIFYCVTVCYGRIRGLKSKTAGRENDSRTVLRLGGSSPNVLIAVDVEDIRNIQYS